MFLKDGFSLTKKIGRLSEDTVFFSNNLVAIIDGASSKTTRLFEGKTPGRVVMELIVERLKIISAKKPNITVIELFNDLNDTILNWHKVGGTFEEAKINPNIRPSATFTCYLPNIGVYGTVASIAEHNFMIDEVLYERSFEIDRMYEKIKKIVTPKLQEVYKNDISKIANILNEVLVPLYNTQPNFQNSDDLEYGYFVLDGFLDTKKAIKEGGIFIKELDKQPTQLTLATDGFDILNSHNTNEDLKYHLISLAKDPCRNSTNNYKIYDNKSGLLNFDDFSRITVDFRKGNNNKYLLECFNKSTTNEMLIDIEKYSLNKYNEIVNES